MIAPRSAVLPFGSRQVRGLLIAALCATAGVLADAAGARAATSTASSTVSTPAVVSATSPTSTAFSFVPGGSGVSSTPAAVAAPLTTSQAPFVTYTPSQPSNVYTDGYGTLSTQINVGSRIFQWGYVMSAALQSGAASQVSEETTMWTIPQNQQIMANPSYHLYDPNATFHGSKTSLVQGQEYQLAMNFDWTCYVAGQPGTCILYVRQNFKIVW